MDARCSILTGIYYMICQLMSMHKVYNSQCSSLLTVQYSKEWEVGGEFGVYASQFKIWVSIKGWFTIMAWFQSNQWDWNK